MQLETRCTVRVLDTLRSALRVSSNWVSVKSASLASPHPRFWLVFMVGHLTCCPLSPSCSPTGAALVEGLEVGKDEVVVVKKRWSAFFATPLDLILR